jgi:hypothetical protein
MSDSAAPAALMIELLSWLCARPRTYEETMEAWRTSCPRMPVWDDALLAGLVEVVPGEVGKSGLRASTVRVTPSGRALLPARL